MGQAATADAELLAELDKFIDGLSTNEGALIAVLHKAQEIFGYLPSDVQNHVAKRLNVPAAKVFGVVTFYSFFNTEKKGKFQISVCMGTACFVRGADVVLEEFERQLDVKTGGKTGDDLFSLDALRCVGACGLAPVVSVNGKVYGRVTKDDVKGIVEEYMAQGGNA
jgi:NADH-quinone oxidoreductase subunit E